MTAQVESSVRHGRLSRLIGHVGREHMHSKPTERNRLAPGRFARTHRTPASTNPIPEPGAAAECLSLFEWCAKGAAAVILFLTLCECTLAPANGQSITLQTASGGFAVSGSSHTFLAGFGAVNGLGVGTPGTGVSVTTSGVSGGSLYTTNYNIQVAGAGGQNTAVIFAYVSSNFSHPAVLQLRSCYPSCTGAASFTTLSTNSGAPTTIIGVPGVLNGTYTASLALFVSNVSGSGAFSGPDSATITFQVYAYSSDSHTSILKESDTLSLSNPSENVQTAVQLTLATAPGGLTISPAADFSVNYGNVNGLGIGPNTGETTVSASGGIIYSTPYWIQPTFAGFSTSTATVKAYVSSTFVHPTILSLYDATASGGPYSAISTSSGSPTALTSSASSGSNVTHYLGLFVSSANGAGIFTGADNATLTYTLTAP